MEMAIANLQVIEKEDAQLLVDNNAVHEVTLEPWHILYTSPGVVVLEETVSGHLNFGLKVPFIQRTEAFVKAYVRAAELTDSASLGNAKKMKEVVAFLAEAAGGS